MRSNKKADALAMMKRAKGATLAAISLLQTGNSRQTLGT